MSKVILVFLAISCAFVNSGGLDLPSYIPKCSLSDPKFSECIVKAANEAIPIIANGDALHNILPASPIAFAEAPVHAIDLEYILYHTWTDPWKTFVLTDALVDFKNGKISLVGILDKAELIAQNYTIISGKLVGIPVSGHGKHNMTLVGYKMNFQGNLGFYKKGEDEYLDYFEPMVDTTVEDVYFSFENIESPENDNVGAYLTENSRNFWNQIKTAVETYVGLIVNSRIKAILEQVPFNKIFLP